jgi:hypothetical protein
MAGSARSVSGPMQDITNFATLSLCESHEELGTKTPALVGVDHQRGRADLSPEAQMPSASKLLGQYIAKRFISPESSADSARDPQSSERTATGSVVAFEGSTRVRPRCQAGSELQGARSLQLVDLQCERRRLALEVDRCQHALTTSDEVRLSLQRVGLLSPTYRVVGKRVLVQFEQR